MGTLGLFLTAVKPLPKWDVGLTVLNVQGRRHVRLKCRREHESTTLSAR